MEIKNIIQTTKHWISLFAIVFSTILYSCGSDGSSVDNTSDAVGGSDMDNAGDDPADTLSIGGSSNGRPSGAGLIKDSTGNSGPNMDSIQNSQSGTNTSTYGDNHNNEKANGMDANKPGNQNSDKNSTGSGSGQSQGGNQNQQ